MLELQKDKEVIKFECSICMDELDLNQNGYILKCGCQFCRDCLKNHITLLFEDNKNLEFENVICPNEPCKKVMDFEDISFILKDEKQLIENLEQKNIISMFEKMKKENQDSQEVLITCPGKYKIKKNGSQKKLEIPKDLQEKKRQEKGYISCEEDEIIVDCNLTFILDRTQKKFIHKCEKYKFQFCLNNCDSIHEISCSEYQKQKIENNKDYRKDLEAKGYRFYPGQNCYVRTERISGCNRITCTMCQISYCYACYFYTKTYQEVYAHMAQVGH